MVWPNTGLKPLALILPPDVVESWRHFLRRAPKYCDALPMRILVSVVDLAARSHPACCSLLPVEIGTGTEPRRAR